MPEQFFVYTGHMNKIDFSREPILFLCHIGHIAIPTV